MRSDSIDFASLLSYSPRGVGSEFDAAREWMKRLKTGRLSSAPPPRSVPDEVALYVRREAASLPFGPILTSDATLVPVPKSSLHQPGSLWVPQQLANSLVEAGLARESIEILRRTTAIRKSATSAASDRPSAQEHFETTALEGTLASPSVLVLVDDIVTQGATLLGMANRLTERFPSVPIRGLAAMRCVSRPEDFTGLLDPCVGRITLHPGGRTRRVP